MSDDENVDFVGEERFPLIVANANRLQWPHAEKPPSLPNP
jgi:hypothetical protein